MDGLGGLVNVITLVGTVIKTYRHIAEARSFANVAGTLAAMISFEYFRFETWAEQSGYLAIDDRFGSSLRSASDQAGSATHLAIQTADKAHDIVAQVKLVLLQLSKLLEKYKIPEKVAAVNSDEEEDDPIAATNTGSSNASQGFLELPASLISKKAVKSSSTRLSRLQLRLDSETGRLRKVKFGWNMLSEVSDREKLQQLIEQLKYWNDALRDIMPIADQEFNGVVTQVRVMGITREQADLKGIENASSGIPGILYDDIFFGARMKRERLASDSGGGASIASQSSLDRACVPRLEDDCPPTVDYGVTTFRGSSGSSGVLSRVVVESFDFGSLSDDKLRLLESRIQQLARLLKGNARPTSLLLPICEGYIKRHPSKCSILYKLPESADPMKRPRTLLSMLPPNKNAPKRPPQIMILPTLEDRYQLASVLAEGILKLHSISWLHKRINSNSIVFFDHGDGFTISQPLMIGFGVSRTSNQAAETVDLRHMGTEFDVYQHPDLRADAHRRYETRYDIYSLGLVLLEIGLWQSIYYLKEKDQDAQQFRRKVKNVCETHLSHLMGKAYQRAVLCCIDNDEIWKNAQGVDGDDSVTVQEIFCWRVVKELRGSVPNPKIL